MMFEKSEALKLKYLALKWLRLDQRCMFIATEVGSYSADVLGINETKMVEVEVKVTTEDLKKDFRKWKHDKYSGFYSSDWSDQWKPTHFYFAMPDHMIESAKEILAKQIEKYPKVDCYGLIQLSDWKIVKRAKWLHKHPPNSRVKAVTALRMGSELIRFHEAWV